MIILEGADGTGKTTLAKYLRSKLNGMIIHAGYGQSWDIEHFHINIIEFAHKIEQTGCPVIIDRWSPSEYVYGKVFRKGPKYDVQTLVLDSIEKYKPTLVFCRNDRAVENHLKNLESRSEMFSDMSEVAKLYDELMGQKFFGDWIEYNFYINDITKFVEELT